MKSKASSVGYNNCVIVGTRSLCSTFLTLVKDI